MRYRIADLIVDIPEDAGITPRCADYLYEGGEKTDIFIRDELYDFTRKPEVPRDISVYMQSGVQFYKALLDFDGIMVHSSAVEYKGYAYLFSGASGMGKSTHTSLWVKNFDGARVFNDDRPAVRCIDGKWYAYGTPWCGKNRVNVNIGVPIAGICFLERGEQNSIRILPPREGLINVIAQTIRKKLDVRKMDLMLNCAQRLIHDIPIYELHCLPDDGAAQLSYGTMSANIKEKQK